jgi:hypothetical protein
VHTAGTACYGAVELPMFVGPHFEHQLGLGLGLGVEVRVGVGVGVRVGVRVRMA